jgi:hypothetical protein
MLKWECRECEAESPPETPDLIPQETNLVKTFYPSNSFGGWEYELFDGFGHAAVMSRTYGTKEECEAELMKDLAQHMKNPEYGECYGVIFPRKVKVKGKLYTLKSNDSGPVTTGS